MLQSFIGTWPRPESRKTSIGCVKKFLLFEEVRRVQEFQQTIRSFFERSGRSLDFSVYSLRQGKE